MIDWPIIQRSNARLMKHKSSINQARKYQLHQWKKLEASFTKIGAFSLAACVICWSPLATYSTLCLYGRTCYIFCPDSLGENSRKLTSVPNPEQNKKISIDMTIVQIISAIVVTPLYSSDRSKFPKLIFFRQNKWKVNHLLLSLR